MKGKMEKKAKDILLRMLGRCGIVSINEKYIDEALDELATEIGNRGLNKCICSDAENDEICEWLRGSK